MLEGIKQIIREQLHNKCYRTYFTELARQEDSYAQWILENEDWKKGLHSGKANVVAVIPMRDLMPGFQVPPQKVVLFVRDGGILDDYAVTAVTDYFSNHPDVKVAYADEDCVNAAGLRHTPWFKPQWSPDTLRSFAYYGNVIAMRTETLQDALQSWRSQNRQNNQNGITETAQDTLQSWSAEPYLGYAKGEYNLYYLMLILSGMIGNIPANVMENTIGNVSANVAEKTIGNIPANATEKAIGVIDKVLYHRQVEKNPILSDEDAAFSDSIYEDTEYPDVTWEDLGIVSESTDYQEKDRITVSVIIPSKDQPDVLKTCVESMMSKTQLPEHISLELVVVDNGSTAHNRLQMEQLVRKYNGQYLYQPMEFNFSIMCNAGAARANGEFLLFLNDDMEIIQEDWVIRMLESAQLPHVGAVGAKLLYPDSDIIQHVGITNLAIGPAHKLLKLHDKNVYYHGQNRHNYDMIGVTAACLMVQTKKFLEIDGFKEILAVAYNDVDLCFSLYDAGYYNVQRNDVVLYHHESLSRGDDLMSEEKKERLLRERSVLYGRHPSLEGYDPFYSEHLAGMKHMYLNDYQYTYEREDYYVDARLYGKEEPVDWENNCLNVNVEKAKLQDKHFMGEVPKAYHIEGWSYVLNMDNCHYDRRLLLIGDEGTIYEVPVICRMRKDVTRILQEQVHVDLAGFVCRVRRESITPGVYTIAMLVKDGTSKQYLYKKTDTKLAIIKE